MSIAIDQSNLHANGSSGTSPIISGISLSGSDRIIFFGLNTENNSVSASGVNFDDGAGGDVQALTQLGTYETGDGKISLWYLLAPHTGAGRRLIATLSAGSNWMCVASSYTGVAQSSTFTTPTHAHPSSSPASDGNTSDTNGSWQVAYAQCNSQITGLTGGTKRSQAPTPGSVETNILADSNGGINSGSTNTLSWSFGASTIEYISVMMRPVAPTTPSVTTDAATDVTDTSATLNGEITDVGAGSVDEEGFVWGTTSQGAPGNVAPASAGYDDYETDSGSFSAVPFDFALSALSPSTTYYARAYAHNAGGYVYGSEISFTTSATPPFRFTNLPGVVFDPDDTSTIYAERLNDILERLEALE